MQFPKTHRIISSVVLLLAVALALSANPALVPGTWTTLTTASAGSVGQGISLCTGTPSTMYWCCGTVRKSTDGGATWNSVSPMSPTIHVRVNPANPLELYAVDGVNGSTYGFWKSTDGGATWAIPQGFKNVATDPTVSCWDCYEAAVDPTDFKHVLVSFHNVWPDRAGYAYSCGIVETNDGGDTWIIHYPDPAMAGPGYAVFFLFDPAKGIGDRNTWMVGCQGSGFFRTTNAGTSWTHVSNVAMTHGGDQVYYSKTKVLYLGSSGSLLRSTDNGATFQTPSMPYAYYVGVCGDGTNMYTGTYFNGGVVLTSAETDGMTWKPYGNGTQSFTSGLTEMAYDPTNHIMYGATNADVMALKIPQTTVAATTLIKVAHARSTAAHLDVTGKSAVSGFDIRGRSVNNQPVGREAVVVGGTGK